MDCCTRMKSREVLRFLGCNELYKQKIPDEENSEKAECALTDRELKKLDKSELLEILIDLSDENEALRQKNAELCE